MLHLRPTFCNDASGATQHRDKLSMANNRVGRKAPKPVQVNASANDRRDNSGK